MSSRKGLTRRQLVRGGVLAMAGSVGAAALAACGETETVIKEVPVEKIITVTEIREVPVETIVTQEVIKEVQVEKVVTKEVQVEKIVEVETVQAPQGVFNIGPVTAVRFGNYRNITPFNPRHGGKITYGSPANMNNLDPMAWPDTWSLGGGGMPLYDFLIAHGPGGEMQPYLANDWEVSDDNLTYTFRLRNDVQFHDGTPFNAEAAKFNFELWMDPANPRGSSANIGEQLARVEAPDEFTLVLTLNAVNVFFLDEIATSGVVFGSPAGYAEFGEDFTRNPVGTGPYKMGEWKENVSLKLVRNEDYNWGPPWAHNRGPAFADEYEAFEIPDVATKVTAYTANDLSFMQHYTLTDMQPFFEDPTHQIFLALSPGQPWYLQSNSVNFPTDDVAVRRALIHATDRGTVTRSVTLGFGALAGSLMVPGTVGYNPELENMYPFDIAKANQLLDEAGYARGSDGFRYDSGGQLLEVSFPDTPNPFSIPYKLNIENAIGISVATPNMEWGTAVEQYLQRLHHHKWQGCVGLEGGACLFAVYHSSNFGVPGNRSFTFYENAEIDTLLDEIRVEADRDVRAEKTHRAHTIVMEAALGIPLVEWGTIFPSNTNKVGGRHLHHTGVFPLLYDMYSTEESA